MSKVYFASDLHLGHNTLCVSLRGMTADESDALIVENWNKIITKYDTVYLLGDIVMEDVSKLHILSKLKGHKIVIGGNHDTREVCNVLADMGIPVIGCLNYKGFICTHIPIHPSEMQFFKGNIHGHIHNKGVFNDYVDGVLSKWEYNPNTNLGDKYFNVNVEFNNYTPVLFTDIIKKF